jgi:uncharacterized protein YlxP (DUF503 family)
MANLKLQQRENIFAAAITDADAHRRCVISSAFVLQSRLSHTAIPL